MMTTPQDTEAAAAISPTGTEARVCADITRRQALGLAKYGTTVEANPLPLPAWLQHAYEETLDQAIYLRRAMEEMAAPQVEQQAERRLTRKARVGGTLFEVGVPERLVLDAAQLAAQRPQGLIDDSVKRELQQLIADNAGRAAFLDAHPAVSQELAGLIEENERLRAALTDQQASQGPAVGAEPDWQAMLYAPRDGSKIELLVEHREYWIALKSGRADGYRQACEGHWVDFNGGGWSWMGTAGQPIGWRPLRAGPAFDVPVQHKGEQP